MMQAIERQETKQPDRCYLVVLPDEADEAAIEAWKRQHPQGRVIRIEYESLEYDDMAA